MIDLIQSIIPYISGLYTLPWILVGFLVSSSLTLFFPQERIDRTMKQIGLIILYCFVPVLVFRIFFDTPIGLRELFFVILVVLTISGMYVLAYIFALSRIRKHDLKKSQARLYMKTVLTNQGRSSAFVGGAMLTIPGWGVPAGIFMAFVGVALFAVVPYTLLHLNNREQKERDEPVHLPWFLKVYPWYFISFAVAAIFLQRLTGLTTRDWGDFGILLRFYTALTIPAALYYVGSGIHPNDLKIGELKKLAGLDKEETDEHWRWVRQIFLLTAVYTPLVFAAIFGLLLILNIIPASWFAVIVINTALPITSTNMFLVPYGLDKRATAHSITWSTLICVPVTVLLIGLFSIFF
jgi:predicted permease